MSIKTTPYGFNPSLTAGLVLWLDASDATTITQTSGNITQWIDKSTSALTATAANNPTLVANVQNGFPGISFDGSSQYFNLGNNLNMGTNQIYIFVVSKFNSTADGAIVGKSLYGSSAARYSLVRSGGTMVPLVEATGGAVNNSGLGSDTSTSARLLNMVWDRSTIYLYQNGSSVFSVGLSDSSNLTTGNSLLIGAYQNGSGGTPPVAGLYMNGYIHEILMYFTSTASPLGNTARQQIESYLAQKWGLTLGAGHPGLTSTVYRSTYLKNTVVKRNIATMVPFYKVFAPRQIAGCSLWLDGADPAGNGVIPANGASIATWVDKSGLGQTITQATTANQALYTSGGGLTFTSGMQYPLNTSVFMTMFSVAYTIFVVEKRAVSGLGFFIGNTAGGGGPLYLGYNGTTVMRFTTASIVDLDYTVPAYSGSDATEPIRIWACRWFGSSVNSRDIGLNGQLSPLTQAFNQAPSFSGNQSIGGCLYGNYVGKMYEMIIFNKAISDSAKQQVESYLAQKWGLTSSLPGAHLNATQPAGAVTTLSLANSRISITSKRITAFTSFRWTITVGNTDTYIQISEFQVGYNNTQVVFVSPSISTAGTPNQWYGPEPAPAAVDNNIGSKALALAVPALFTVTVASPITVNMYRWASANDSTPGRNPTQWTVDGSADGVTFVRLHTQNTTYAGPNTTFTYTSWINFTY